VRDSPFTAKSALSSRSSMVTHGGRKKNKKDNERQKQRAHSARLTDSLFLGFCGESWVEATVCTIARWFQELEQLQEQALLLAAVVIDAL
jgi:hypothetical protein